MDNSKLPAYPRTAADKDGNLTTDFPEFNGLSKFEVFVKAAMEGYCANTALMKACEQDPEIKSIHKVIAIMAVDTAKATLSELSKQQQG